MSFFPIDPDEWETVTTHESYGTFAGVPMGSLSVGQRRRAPEDVAKIKAERKQREDDEILRRADAIRAERALRKGA